MTPTATLSDAKLDILSAVVATELTFAGLSRLLVEWALECLGAERCVVAVKHPGGPRLRFEGTCEQGSVTVSEWSEPLVIAGKIGSSADENDQEDPSTAETVLDFGSAAWLEAPIAHGTENFGEIAVYASSTTAFGPQAQQTLNKLAASFGFLLDHRSSMERAKELAVRDELTGLYNRRHLSQSLEQWIPKSRQSRIPISVLLLDVDHFKLFNDTWGHAVGDRVLRILGDLMRSLFRSQDIVCRYGGEEFAVLLCDHRPGESKDHPKEVGQFAERLRQEAEKLRLTAEDGRVLSQITISGGIATFPWDCGSADELLLRADEALYRAKRNGRNRIYFASRAESSKAV